MEGTSKTFPNPNIENFEIWTSWDRDRKTIPLLGSLYRQKWISKISLSPIITRIKYWKFRKFPNGKKIISKISPSPLVIRTTYYEKISVNTILIPGENIKNPENLSKPSHNLQKISKISPSFLLLGRNIENLFKFSNREEISKTFSNLYISEVDTGRLTADGNLKKNHPPITLRGETRRFLVKSSGPAVKLRRAR